MYACFGGNIETVQELINRGANVECYSTIGHTPFMLAASSGHIQVAIVWFL